MSQILAQREPTGREKWRQVGQGDGVWWGAVEISVGAGFIIELGEQEMIWKSAVVLDWQRLHRSTGT